jgi:hypothetical protein
MRLRLVCSSWLLVSMACTCGEGSSPTAPPTAAQNAALLRERRVKSGWYGTPTAEPDPPVIDYERLDSGVPPRPVPTRPGDPRLARSFFDPPVTVTSTKWDFVPPSPESYSK